MKINVWTLYSKLLISPLLVFKTRIFGPYILKTPFVFTSPYIQNPDGVNRNWHNSLEHLDEGDREVKTKLREREYRAPMGTTDLR